MPRGVEQNQLQNATTANQRSGQFNAGALDAQNAVVPALKQEITNPQGFSQPGMIAMNTANEQGVGGATAGAVGQGNLEAARTRNAGGFQAANDEAARSGQRQVSQNAVDIQGENEAQRQKNQQAGIAGEENMYNTDTGATLGALGLSNSALAGASNSSQANSAAAMGWTKLGLDAASKAASGFGG